MIPKFESMKLFLCLVLLGLVMPGLTGCDSKDGPDNSAVKTFVGSDKCAGCHAQQSKEFLQSGHPYKIMKVNGAQPDIPFLPEGISPPAGHTWNDISHTIGGY